MTIPYEVWGSLCFLLGFLGRASWDRFGDDHDDDQDEEETEEDSE
ncbi:hypothetical protein [Haloplanus rubicundus]|nr:hypothetical protein [Haloplanus rubicundus]